MPAPKVIIPIPSQDFDPSEVALSWQVLRKHGIDVLFATPDGRRGHADPLMLSGEGLDLWGAIPVLKKIKVLGLALRANGDARRAYAQMEGDRHFLAPLSYADLEVAGFDGLVLPGGHWSRGMRRYLEDAQLQQFVGAFFDSGKPVGAVCHGVVLAARSISPRTGKSALHGRKTVALPWDMEKKVWRLMKYLGRVWNPAYYRTYEESAAEAFGYRSVQAEVTRALASPQDFVDVPAGAAHHFRKASGLFRDSASDSRPAWVVCDGNYVSARWPGDMHTFALRLAQRLLPAS